MKILIIAGKTRSLVNFRGDLIKDLISAGHEVLAIAGDHDKDSIIDLKMMGVEFSTFPVKRNSLNPISDINMLLFLVRFIKKNKPEMILSYTIKPVIWGGIASRICNINNFYAMITGLGFAFQSGGIKRKSLNYLVKVLYRMALVKSKGVIFQNDDNQSKFIDEGIIQKSQSYRVNGSGVNTSHFAGSAIPTGKVKFLSIARLLKEKGLREYYEAAATIKKNNPNLVFQLLGPEDSSPDSIKIEEVNKWVESGVIEYLGESKDVRPYLQNCTVFVLASYHEGMPRTVLEAMSTGRPIITTNVAGCKDTVINGLNGYLVDHKSVEQLAISMSDLAINRENIERMGMQSRIMALEKFDVVKVNKELFKIMEL
ncbi:glycosyltransferase family 4 protein [Thalassotalea sp. Y01]|uniref:glycosyltransferase family 4 protein n=1 Tax=Thalassotalea sp. Y01 TaxID=2729613 RepID=UPI00145D5B1E|nr:glycosyltransferase family 4 protein [Thalassotalea sp. Y01]NMP16517.1 glycosyltransferase family 4 protein [Thalassotalea sp. Y01]